MINRTPEPFPDHPLREAERFLPLGRWEAIHLVEHEDEVLNALGDRAHQRELITRDGRVGADHDDGGVDLRNERAGGGAVGFEHGADPRRIDEAEPGTEQGGSHRQLGGKDPLRVLRIARLGHILGDIANGDRLPAAFLQAYSGTRVAVADHCGYGSCRDHAGREQGLADQGIDERRLAPLELPHAGHVEAAGRDALAQRTCLVRHGHHPRLPSDLLQPVE
jgi:hypothetical protein